MHESLRTLLRLAAALGRGDAAALDAALVRADAAASAWEVEELLLQSYLFLGYPAALNGIARWRELSGRQAPEATADDHGEWKRRGEAVCARVYGGQYERLRENVAALHPDMERWMVTEGYGKVLARPGLDLARRELCTVAILAGQRAAPQLYAHLRGALNAGVPVSQVDAAVELLVEELDPAREATLRETWNAVRGRRPADAAAEDAE